MKSAAIKNAQWIKEQALALGFLSCGISKAGFGRRSISLRALAKHQPAWRNALYGEPFR